MAGLQVRFSTLPSSFFLLFQSNTNTILTIYLPFLYISTACTSVNGQRAYVRFPGYGHQKYFFSTDLVRQWMNDVRSKQPKGVSLKKKHALEQSEVDNDEREEDNDEDDEEGEVISEWQ